MNNNLTYLAFLGSISVLVGVGVNYLFLGSPVALLVALVSTFLTILAITNMPEVKRE